MARVTLKSANTAVIIGGSPAFKTYDDSGSIFAGVQSANFGFSLDRENLKQIGSQDQAEDTITRHPDVNLSMDYSFTPTYANEELLGINYDLDVKPKESITKTLSEKSYNFYFYNHPDQGEDGLGYIKNIGFPNNGEVISIGNCFLTNYELEFSVGSIPSVKVDFLCSNIQTENYLGPLSSPAINLKSGNASGVGNFDIENVSYIDERKFGDIYDLDRTKIETQLPHDVTFEIKDLQIGGQKISLEDHRLNSFKFTMPIERANLYRLGSDYVCERKIQYPINATASFSSLVSSHQAGFISGLLREEDTSQLTVTSLDCKRQITSQFFFENLKLESSKYETLVNESTIYTLDFSFQIYDEFGLKTIVTEQDIGATRFIDASNSVKDFVIGDVPSGWVAGDLDGVKVAFGTKFPFEVYSGAFEDCINISSGELYIPPTISTMGVNAFKGCINLPGFYFDVDSNLETIEDGAFENCSSISSFKFPDSLKYIGESSFRNCFSSKEIEMNEVLSIGDYAFYNCYGINGPLALPEKLITLGESAFENCSGFNGGLYLGDTITTIEPRTFKNANSFSYDLIIPNNILEIGDEAFYQCSGFNGELTLSQNLSGVNDYTFYSCSSLTGNLILPDSVERVGRSSFQNCSGLNGFFSGGSGLTHIGDESFESCNKLSSLLKLPGSLLEIGSGAFKNCRSLEGPVLIPSGIESIGEHALSGCVSIQDIYINSPPTVFEGNNAFADVSGCLYVTPFYYNDYKVLVQDGLFQGMPVCYGSLDTIIFDANTSQLIKTKRDNIPSGWYSNQTRDSLLVIGSTCEKIEAGAFTDSVGLQGLFVTPETLEYIGDNAFRNCSFSEDLVLSPSISGIGSGAFEGCTGFIGYLELPESLEIIPNNAFKNCYNLTEDIIIPESTISIGSEAFYNCTGFTGDLSIGFSVTQIGEKAFFNCVNLTSYLEIPPITTLIGDYAFFGCSGFQFFEGPEEAIYIGNYAFAECSNMEGDLILPSDLTYLGSGAFRNCSSLDGTIDLSQIEISGVFEETFRNCSSLEGDLFFPESILSIGANSFNGCTSISGDITLTDYAAQSIGTNAFLGCSFDSLIIHPATISVDQGEYDYFKDYEIKLVLSRGLSGVTNDGFADYKFTGNLTLPATLEYIGDRAFLNCTGFDGFYNFQSSAVRFIGDSAFYNMDQMNGDLMFPDTLLNIGDSAFYNNSSVDGRIVFGDQTTGIGSYSFYNVRNAYGSLVIPDSVSGVGSFAFFDCTGLDGNLTLGNQMLVIKESTFENCNNLFGDLIIPDSVLDIENSAFKNCFGFITDLTITDIAANSLNGKNSFDQSDFSRLIISDFVTNISNVEFDYFQNRELDVVFQENLSGIGDFSFDNYKWTGALVLPETLTGIGERAFYNCTGFASELIIPQNVSGIGEEAFFNCNQLSGNLIIQDYLIDIGDGAFVNCSSLDGYLQISDLTAFNISSYENLFLGTNFTELRASSTDGTISGFEFDSFVNFLGDLTLIETVGAVGDRSFDGFGFQGNLNSFGTVFDIGDFAFSGDTFVGDLEVYSQYVGRGAFYNCTFDGVLTFPTENTIEVDDYAFYNCDGFISGLKISREMERIGNYSFYNNSSLGGEFVLSEIPEEFNCSFIESDVFLTGIGEYAFAQNSNLTGNLFIPSTVKEIGSYAFLNNSSLDGFLFVGSGLKRIREGVFKGCTSLSGCNDNLVIPGSVTRIDEDAFYNCIGLDNKLTIGAEAAKSIGTNAFFNCDFKEIIIPNWTESIADLDYDYFINDQVKLSFEEGVVNIYDDSFDGFSFTGSLTFPETLVTIGSRAFDSCDSIVGNLIIPSLVQDIGENAFNDCSAFNGIISLPEGLTGIRSGAFRNLNNLSSALTLPEDLEYIGEEAFLNCGEITGDIDLGDFIEYIGDQAFAGCTKIKDVYVDAIPTGSWNGENALAGPTGWLKVGVLNYNEYFQQSVEINGVNYFQGMRLSGVGVADTVFYTGNTASQFGDPDVLEKQRWSVAQQADRYVIGPADIHNGGVVGVYPACWLVVGERARVVAERAFKQQYYLRSALNFTSSVELIDDEAFWYCFNVPSISLGVNTQLIGDRAFFNCYGAQGELDLQRTTGIGTYAFYNCYGLDSIVFSDELEEIQPNTFQSCRGVKSPLSLQSTAIKTIGSQAFDNCTGVPTLFLPPNLERIDWKAFYNCESISNEISFSSSLESIGYSAFYQTSIIGSLDFPPLLTELRTSCFYDTNISSINWGNVSGLIGSSIFMKCSNLKNFNGLNYLDMGDFPASAGTATRWGTDSTFKETAIEKVVMPADLRSTDYGINLFSKCKQLKEVEISGGVDYINDGTFELCDSLRIPDLPDSVSGIGKYAFKDCFGRGQGQFYSYELNPNVEFIDDYAFSYTSNFAIYTNPADSRYGGMSGFYFGDETSGNLKYIGEWAFSYSPQKNEIVLPSGLESVGNYAWYQSNVSGLIDISYMPNLNYMGHNTFAYSDITGVIWNTQLTTVPHTTFQHCLSLTGISNFDDVKHINYNSFQYTLSGVTAVLPSKLEDKVPNPGTYDSAVAQAAFRYSKLTGIDFSNLENDISLGTNSFSSMTGLQLLQTNNVIKYGSSCFKACGNLTSADITYNGVNDVRFLSSVFETCTSLTTVDLPDRMTSMADSNFKGCSSLRTLDLSNTNITYIGSSNFSSNNGTSQFHGIDVDIDNGKLTSIGNNNWQGSQLITGVTIPSTVNQFGNYNFSNCRGGFAYYGSGLDRVTFESTSLLSIGTHNWQNSDILGVDLPPNLQDLGNYQFNMSSYYAQSARLSGISFPDSMQSMLDFNFSYQRKLRNVEWGQAGNFTSMGNNNFQYCDRLMSGIGDYVLRLPEGLNSIGNNNFRNCYSLSGIQLPDSLLTMGNSNFSLIGVSAKAPWLSESLIIPSGIVTMGDSNFKGNNGIYELRISNGFKGTIGKENWQDCQIRELYIDFSGLEGTFGNSNFANNESFTDIELSCPYSAWVGTNNFGSRGTPITIKIHPNFIDDYTNGNAFSGSQGLIDGDEITTI